MSRSTALAALWRIAASQHGVVARRQLAEAGLSEASVRHNIDAARLHRVGTDVYAVGRSELSERGRFMAAVLSCGRGAALSHLSAAILWGLRLATGAGAIHVSVPAEAAPRRAGVVVHRRKGLAGSIVVRAGIPVTDPVLTLIDVAPMLQAGALESAIKEADVAGLLDPERLRTALDAHGGRPGVRVLRALLDRRTFRLTDSELERLFLGLCRRGGLRLPETGWEIGSDSIDFFWPDVGLVVETDGLRYHRTPAQQTRDRLRDQRHTAAGLTPLRFTHEQIKFDPNHVAGTLATVLRRLEAEASGNRVKEIRRWDSGNRSLDRMARSRGIE